LPFTVELIDHFKLHSDMMLTLLRQLYAVEFSGFFIKDDEILAVEDYLDKGDFEPGYEILADYARPANAVFQIRLNGKVVTDSAYDQDGHTDIDLVFLQGSAREFLKTMPKLLSQIREALFENFELETLLELIDFGADFLEKTQSDFSYEIKAFGSTIFTGRLEDEVLHVGIEDPAAWARIALFLLKGADALALSIRSPFDILALLDTVQAALRRLAISYEERGMRIEVSALGKKLMSCGDGVKSNLMTNRFGPTAIHLESFLKILTSALTAWK